MPPSFKALHLLQGTLGEDLARAVGEMATPPDEIAISIEMSERLLPKIVSAFRFKSLTVDGTIIPIVGMFTPKIPPQPLLEMADQVAWRTQRQYKEYNPQHRLMPEFTAVFPRGAHTLDTDSLSVASISGGSDPKWRIDFDESDKLSITLRSQA
jgi:hypothetical protein